MYRQLLVEGGQGTTALWAHQADVLRSWHGSHLEKKDVAIELPTGAGKTLVGAVIAEFLRRRENKPVAYLCPDKLLARQTAEKLKLYRVPTVLLIDEVSSWNQADRIKYERANAVAVSVYSHVFNSNPALNKAGLLLLDDAHAAEGYVASPWKLEITREKNASAYQDLLSALEGTLDPLVFARLRNTASDDTRDVYLASPVGIAANAPMIEQVLGDAAATERVSAAARHAWKNIRDHVDRCLVYVSHQQMLIRPLIVPTLEHQAFHNPDRRIYMSATLGSGGELERAFGRRKIERIPIPNGWENQGTGRRFFVFPELTSDLAAEPDSNNTFVKNLIAQAGRALVLAPDENTARKFIKEQNPEDHTVLRATDVKEDLTPFTEASAVTLVLANRYDGIDLPGDACRLVVLVGWPAGSDLQEKFLHNSVGAVTVLQERIRARIMQGSGRATRDAHDYATVLVLRSDLTSMLADPNVVRAMHPEVQAELVFGLDNSMDADRTSTDLLQLLELFNARDPQWIAADTGIAEDRDKRQRILPKGTEELQDTVKQEVAAWEAVWAGNWDWALTAIRQVLDGLTTTGPAKQYAALWNYLGFVAARRLATRQTDGSTYDKTADDYYQKARRLARGTIWGSRMTAPCEQNVTLPPTSLDPLDEAAMNVLLSSPDRTRFVDEVTTTSEGLQGTEDHQPYENALVTLGFLAGATESFTYDDDTERAKPDAVWVFGDLQWVIWEAKNRATTTGSVGAENVRQAGAQLRTVESDRKTQAPSDAVCLLVTPKPNVLPEARNLAEGHVFLTRPKTVLDVFENIVRAWRKFRSRGLSTLDTASAAEIFRSENALPTQWLQALCTSPLRPPQN